MSSTASTNGSGTAVVPEPIPSLRDFVGSPTRPPTLTELIGALDDCASSLYDVLCELDDAIGRVENSSAELRRRTRAKRVRDARYRRRRAGAAA